MSKWFLILNLAPRQLRSIICASHLNMASRLEQWPSEQILSIIHTQTTTAAVQVRDGTTS
jgi:hypothetical protein